MRLARVVQLDGGMRALLLMAIIASACATSGVLSSPSAAPTAEPPAPTSPTPSPDPTRPSEYRSREAAYRISLSEPWRYARCGSGAFSSPTGARYTNDVFTPIPVLDQYATDTGTHFDHVWVRTESNPNGLTAQQWEESGKIGFSVDRTLAPTVVDGRPGLLVNSDRWLVAHRGVMYDINVAQREGGTPLDELRRVRDSFRFLTDQEIAALPTPTIEPRALSKVVDDVTRGFVQRDPALIELTADDCVNRAVWRGGAAAIPRERFIADLRERFERGLRVSIDPTSLREEGETAFLRSRWSEPGREPEDLDLMFRRENDRWEWIGTITVPLN